MEADVQRHQRVDAVLLDIFLGAPLEVCGDHLAELRAPVAQVVDAHALVAQVLVDLVERVADHRGGQVADVEALGDIDRGVVDADDAALTLVGGAVLVALLQHALDDGLRVARLVQEEIEVAAHALDAVDHLVGRNGACELAGNGRRAHAQRPGQLEARERKVAHVGVRRCLQKALHAVNALTENNLHRFGDPTSNILLEFHSTPLLKTTFHAQSYHKSALFPSALTTFYKPPQRKRGGRSLPLWLSY